MPTNYDVTAFIYFSSVTGGTGTLSWSSASIHATDSNTNFITDQNDDGNWDIGVDTWGTYGDAFSGYVWTAPNGTVYPIFKFGTYDYYLPYDQAEYDVGAVFPSSGSTSQYSDNASAHPMCFTEGTWIATDVGEQPVEALRIGDRVVTASGGLARVLWLGRQTLRPAAMGAKSQPVCIKAGALGGGLPHSDLTVTADHGMVLDGNVINASALVNGETIDFVPMAEMPDAFTVYHIETEAHDVILANGALSETFIDAAGRKAFDNYAEYLDLYGAERIIPEIRAHRITSARLLPDDLASRLGIRPTGACSKVG